MSEKKEQKVMGLLMMCMLKRESHSDWEVGLMIDEGRKGYIDRFGNLLTDGVWEAKTDLDFCVNLAPILTTRQAEVEQWQAKLKADREKAAAWRAEQERKKEKAGKRPRLSKQGNTCTIDGCENEAKAARGLCWKHYRRELRHGNTDDPDYVNSGKICSVEGCEKEAHGKRLCQVHLQRFNKYGDVHHVENLRGQMDPICRIDGCNEETVAHHLCNKHHLNFRYHRGVNAKDANEYVEKKNRGEI